MRTRPLSVFWWGFSPQDLVFQRKERRYNTFQITVLNCINEDVSQTVLRHGNRSGIPQRLENLQNEIKTMEHENMAKRHGIL